MIYQYIRTYSLVDSNYEDHEFLLCWFGRDGAFYQWMFTDWDEDRAVKANVVNEDSPTGNIQSIIESESRKYTLIAEDLSINDLTIIGSLLVNRKIIRLHKTGTFEYVAVDSNSYRIRQSNGRYQLEFDIVLSNLQVCR
jgi:hypothetical protein